MVAKMRPKRAPSAPYTVTFQRIPVVLGELPDTDTPHARVLRLLAMNGSKAVASFAEKERAHLFMSLATTLSRATYRYAQFEAFLRTLENRKRRFSGLVGWDNVAKFVAFESADFLTAARSFVDLVVYVAARRAGHSVEDADRWKTFELVVMPLSDSKFNVPEVVALREERTWFERLNEYRNALVHRGVRSELGYFEVGSTMPGADDPEANVAWIPDLRSVKRPNRPDKWTFDDGERVEQLLARAYHGLLRVVEALSVVWQMDFPQEGKLDAEMQNQEGIVGVWSARPPPGFRPKR